MSEQTPNGLDAVETKTCEALVRLASCLLPAINAELLCVADISHLEYAVMAGLASSARGAMRMSNLAAQCEASAPRISRVVGCLEDRRWVIRRADSSDARVVVAELTTSGWEKITASVPAQATAMRTLILDSLDSDQMQQLIQISDQIVNACGRQSLLR